MKNTRMKLLCAVLCAALLLTAGCGTKEPQTPSATEPGKEETMIENNVHKDKIVTEASFRIPKKLEDRKSDFTIPVLFTDGCVLQAGHGRSACGDPAFPTAESQCA